MNEQPASVLPDWVASQLARQAAWDENVIARYLTVAGATVDITYDSAKGTLIAACTACPARKTTDTRGLSQDTPEQEQARIDEWLPVSRKRAQDHAETCRALPRPPQ